MKKKKKEDLEVPTEKQIEEITDICNNYRTDMNRISENRNRMEELYSHLEESTSDFEISLINDDIEKIGLMIQKDEEKTSYFRWALYYLNDRARGVMKQLYVDGYDWNSVVDEKGKPMSAGTIGRIRTKSIYDMAARIAQKRKEMGKTQEAEPNKTKGIS